VCELTTAALRELGYTVLEADSGEAALSVLGQRPDVTLVFTDVVMPRMDGRGWRTRRYAERPD
jgi:CheY-like chemotaxis protein